MALLLDTQVLVWIATGDARLSGKVVAILASEHATPGISAVTVWEYADLQARGRIPTQVSLEDLVGDYHLHVLDLPGDLWQFAASLPVLHKDPVDRMLIAHAIAADLTIVTADKLIRRYPVATLW